MHLNFLFDFVHDKAGLEQRGLFGRKGASLGQLNVMLFFKIQRLGRLLWLPEIWVVEQLLGGDPLLGVIPTSWEFSGTAQAFADRMDMRILGNQEFCHFTDGPPTLF